MMKDQQADIKENDIFEQSPKLLSILLKDHTLSTEEKQVNIFWATDSYAHRGDGYQYSDKITVEAITGANGDVIVPRAVKSRQEQKHRSKEMAEIFTPSWICNTMNNLVDNAWFGREGVFNTEVENSDGSHSWIVNTNPVVFPEDKTWRDYVNENRLEITCGEAPFLASRYDTVTGEFIPVEHRIGLLDRKLRVVGENTSTSGEWLKAAQSAFQSTYGFEWQGDNLVLARESLLFTFIDYYRTKFGKDPSMKSLEYIAYIISWNIWQMDGLKGVIPNSCFKTKVTVPAQLSLFDDPESSPKQQTSLFECPGCKNKDIHSHNGIYTLIKDWKEDKVLTFISLIKKE